MSSEGRYSSLPEAPRPSSWRTETGAPLLGSSRASRGGATGGGGGGEPRQSSSTSYGYQQGGGGGYDSVSPAPTGSSMASRETGASTSQATSSSASIPIYRPSNLRTSLSAAAGGGSGSVQPRTTLYNNDDGGYGAGGGPELSSTSPSRTRTTGITTGGAGARTTASRLDNPTSTSRSVHMDVGSSLSDSMPNRHKASASSSLRASTHQSANAFSTPSGGGGGATRRHYQEEASRHDHYDDDDDGMPAGPPRSSGTPSGLPSGPPSRQTQQQKFHESVTSHQKPTQRPTSHQQQRDNQMEEEQAEADGYQEAKPRPSGHGYGNDEYSRQQAAPSGGSGGIATAPPVRRQQHTTTATAASGSAPSQVGGQGLIRDEELYSDIVFLWLGPDFTTFCKVGAEEQRYILLTHIPANRNVTGGVGALGNSGAAHLVNLTLTPKQLSVFTEMEPIGALVYQIKQLLSGQALSHLQQSLKNAIRKQLAQYFEYVGELRKKGGVTLVELVQASHIAKPQLLQLHQLLVESQTVKGGELVTKLQHLNHQGSKRLASVLECIYLETVQPLLAMSVSWITRGEVSDPFKEFYIKVDLEVTEDSDTYWTQKYTLRSEMLPSSFTTGPIAQKILLVGKNVNFIKRSCRAKDWHLHPDLIRAAEESTFGTIGSVVDEALEATNEATYKMLMDKHNLQSTLQDLRAFMLVAYDDLFDPLIDRLTTTLKRRASDMVGSSVDEHLQAVLRELPTWTTRSTPVTVRAVMDSRKDTVQGWDAFVLELEILPPLNHVIHKVAMANYKKLFKTLWRAKCTDVILKKAWRQNSLLYIDIRAQQRRNKARATGKLPTADVGAASSLAFNHKPEMLVKIRELLGVSERLGAELSHFVKNYYGYLIYEAILTSWDKLQKGLKTAKSVDELRSVHDHYQQQLMAYTLLQAECGDATSLIDNIIDCAREYCHLQERGLMRLFETGEGDVSRIQHKFMAVADRYRSQVNQLLRILEEQHLTFDFLHFLGLRVNFNRYYRMSDEDLNAEGSVGAGGGDGVTTAEW